MADSSLTTYFGKPAFHSYGNGNVLPAQGGLVYGDYMKTHNINPHSGENHPKYRQCYERAMIGNMKVKKTPGKNKKLVMESVRTRNPEPPRQAEEKRPMTAKMLDEQKNRFAILPPETKTTDVFPISQPKHKVDKKLKNEIELDKKQGKAIKKVASFETLAKASSRRSIKSARSTQRTKD